MADLLDDPTRPWWDDRDTDECRDPRRHPAAGADRGPRRGDPARRRRRRRLGRGVTCTGSTCASRRWGSRASARSSGWSTATAGRSAAARPRSTRRRGTPPRATTSTSAPSMRMVVSLADFDDSRWINLTGVSGHPFSDHYTDQTDLWARARPCPGLFTRDAVEAAGEHTLTLGAGTADPDAGRACRDPARPASWSRQAATGGLRSVRVPLGRHGAGDRAVVGLGGDVEADLVVVEQHPDGRADRHPAEGAVVAAAAAAHPQRRSRETARPGTSTTSAVRRRRGPGAGRPARAGRGRPGRARSALGTPPSRGRGRAARTGSTTRLPAADQTVEQRGGAGLGADRDVRRHGRRAAYLRRRQHVLRDRPARPRRPRAGRGGGGRSAAGRAARAWRRSPWA